MRIIPKKVFRAYDLRGIAGEDLTPDNVKELAKAYATWLLRRRIFTCVVGYDMRESGPKFHSSFIDGLVDSGIDVFDIGVSLSQIVYFAQYLFRTPGCAMITASHNPREYNGFKLGSSYSETMMSDEIEELYAIYKSGLFKDGGKKGSIQKQDICDTYINDIISKSEPIKRYNVVIDGLHDTSGVFLPKAFKQAGCNVIEYHTNPDPTFPLGTPDPTEQKHLEMLGAEVLKERADLGFCFDPDGDRIGITDEKGNIIWNDSLIALFAKDVLEYMPGSKIIFNNLCSKQVSDVIKDCGGKPIMWITGHSFIAEKLHAERAPFGGELSGHMFFLDNFYGHEDTFFASMRLMGYLTRKGITLSQAVASLPKYISSPEIKVGTPDETKNNIVSGPVTDMIKKAYPNANYSTIDGIRIDTDTSMLVFRPSQNGPYSTIRFESRFREEYASIKRFVTDILKSVRGIDLSYGVNLESLN